MIDNIDFLIAKETIQVNKSRQEEARFFTNPITGECGIDLTSLSFLCGGIAVKNVEAFVMTQNEPFLQPEQSERIVRASVCAATLQYFGEIHRPRKTLAQHWGNVLNPIVPVLHKKTSYQAVQPTDEVTQLKMQLEAAQRENARLKQLVKEGSPDGITKWHRIMGQLLQNFIPIKSFDVRVEEDTSKVDQLLDVLLLKRLTNLPQADLLPDGLAWDKEIGLLSYKSHHESLTAWAIQELIGHYAGYRKILERKDAKHVLPAADKFQLYAVTAMYPQTLVKQVGDAWKPTSTTGVYNLYSIELNIVVIVTSQVVAATHNLPWNLLSHDPELIRYALGKVTLEPELQKYFVALANC